ncbi:hypothetical protein AB0B94_13780 [Micromonospora sp. NPDC048986]|uniref:hypothetical protein n=1 Tax=Micromonospora sp. NPDC048986 TaxID=3155644 RepID=UPI0033E1104F
MDQGRQRRLVRLGFRADEAAALSALRTRNFMWPIPAHGTACAGSAVRRSASAGHWPSRVRI